MSLTGCPLCLGPRNYGRRHLGRRAPGLWQTLYVVAPALWRAVMGPRMGAVSDGGDAGRR